MYGLRCICLGAGYNAVNCVSMNALESFCSGKLGVWLVYIQAITRCMDCGNDVGRVSCY